MIQIDVDHVTTIHGVDLIIHLIINISFNILHVIVSNIVSEIWSEEQITLYPLLSILYSC